MSSNGPPATFPGHPSDQSLQSARLAAAGPNPSSFPPDEEENKGKLEKDRQRREGEEEKRDAGEGVSGGGGAALSCHV